MGSKLSKDQFLKKYADQYGVRLDIGCGERKQKGFIGIDIRAVKGVDIVHDLTKFPWPIPDDTIAHSISAHLIEHISRENLVFMRFMDELWRITKVGGRTAHTMPYGGSPGYWQDPTHVNGCTEITWAYFDPLAKDPYGNLYNLYTIYRPKPWKIIDCAFSANSLEVLLEKRAIDKSYRTMDSFEK